MSVPGSTGTDWRLHVGFDLAEQRLDQVMVTDARGGETWTRFAHAVFAGQTQIGRALVREEALPAGDHTEVLDWERASAIVEGAPGHCERPEAT